MAAKYIVTITPPTPNGDLHLGHLSGPFLAADVMQRILKQRGHDVVFVSYSDDYQSYLPRKTNFLNREPFVYGAMMRRAMQLSLELADIHLDCFMQAANNAAYKKAGEHYAKLIHKQVDLRPHKTFYCPQCDVYGYEGFGRTACNWCGTSSDASQCEHCAKVPAIEHIHAMTCMNCQGEMQQREVVQHVWNIGQNYPAVASALAQRPKRVCLENYLAEVLSQTGDQWQITRPHDAGLPLDALQNYPTHTWFLGLSGYRASVDTLLQERPSLGTLQDWWNRDTELVHFLGFDCSYSHAVGYSAQLLADPDGPRPGTLITNRFLKLDGQDFSTSRGHAIWIKDITGQYPSDALRLYCALHAPETRVENFDRADFQRWARETFTPLSNIPPCRGVEAEAEGAQHHALLAQADAWQRWQRFASLEQFSMAGMARALLDFADLVRLDRHFATSPTAWRMVAELANPLCPTLAQTLQQSQVPGSHAHAELASEPV